MEALCLRCFVDVSYLGCISLNGPVRVFLAPKPGHIQENKGWSEKSIF